jgi:hypothetical protein
MALGLTLKCCTEQEVVRGQAIAAYWASRFNDETPPGTPKVMIILFPLLDGVHTIKALNETAVLDHENGDE